MGDYGDLDDLRARLHGVESDLEQRLVPVIGSGLSNTVIPNVTEMTKLFGQAMPKGSEAKFSELIEPILGTTLGYQNAASLLKLRAGDTAIAKVIRNAVLTSALKMSHYDGSALAPNSTECEMLVRTRTDWPIPDGYKGLARLYKRLDGSQRGPIITTNFDPLLEVAFLEEGIDVSPVPVPFDVVPAKEQLDNQTAIPILHVHGYWTSNSTLNTAAQLTKPRPRLEGLLREIMRSSVTLVVGYGGWEDAFMVNLAARIREANLLDADILWSAYSADSGRVLQNHVLSLLDGAPGFSLYIDIDGNKLFWSDISAESASLPVAPFGYTGLPLNNPPTTYNAERFVEGREPGWADAVQGEWPLLQPGKALLAAAQDVVNGGGGKGIIATGPMGEGKTLALRQVAVALADANSQWTVYWREAGAPRLSMQWLADLRERDERLIICADEADLIASDLVATRELWAFPESGVIFLLASHDRLWRATDRNLHSLIEEIAFHGLADEDATVVVEAWAAHGLLPAQAPSNGNPVVTVSEQLRASSRALVEGQHTTLFGAVLDVRHGRDLSQRITDLVDRLSVVNVRDDDSVNLGDVFGGICLIQDACDRYGALGRGATRSVIAAMVGLNGVFADGKILNLLGREAAIAFSGDRVYSRHPAIARTVIEVFRNQNRAGTVARMVGQAGARLRDQGGLADSEYRSAYLISKELHVDSEIIEAAKGAVSGAPDLLEPRVTLLSHWRKIDPEVGWDYVRRIAPQVAQYRDYGAAIRAYLNEYSRYAAIHGEAQFGLGLLGLALADGTGFVIDKRRAQYILVSLAKLARQVRDQSKSFSEIYVVGIALLDRVAGSSERERYVGRASTGDLDQSLSKMPMKQLCSRLSGAISRVTATSVASSGMPTSLALPVSFNELARLQNPPH